MKVAALTPGRVKRWRLMLLAALVLVLPLHGMAQGAAAATLAEQRAKAVTQVVLGILSYARWPVEPEQLRLCLIGPARTLGGRSGVRGRLPPCSSLPRMKSFIV